MKNAFLNAVALIALLMASCVFGADLPQHYRLRPIVGPLASEALPTGTNVHANRVVARSLHGVAEYRLPEQDWKPVKVGVTAFEGVTFQTGRGSLLDLFLGENGPVVRISPESKLTFLRLRLDSTGAEKVIETELFLHQGRILGSVKKMARASKYEIRTPAGTASIRGTEYSISANGNLHVVSGSVIYWDRNGKRSVNLQAGQAIAVSSVVNSDSDWSLFEKE